jgi:hypothetical protein
MDETFGTHVRDKCIRFSDEETWQKNCLEYSDADKRTIFKFTFKKQRREEVVYSLLGQLGIEDGYTITFARNVGVCMQVVST